MRRRSSFPCRAELLRRVHRFPRILDHGEGLELDIDELAAALLDAADIDVLDDFAGLRIDHEGSARTRLGLVVPQARHRLVAVELAAGLLDHVEDHRHACLLYTSDAAD